MAYRRLFLAVLIAGVGCGGGSKSENSTESLEGIWRGDLIQGAITCSDGSFIGACSGCTVGDVHLEIFGGDDVGSVVTVQDTQCLMGGVRTRTGFTATPISDCFDAFVSLEFTLKGENEAIVHYNFDIDRAPVEPGEVTCVPASFAEITRD